MAGSGGDAPPMSASNGGEFLLSLLQKHQQSQPPMQPPQTPGQQLPGRGSHVTPPPQQQYLPNDPAVAAVGPSINFPPQWSSNGRDLPTPSWPQSASPPFNHNFLGFPQNPWTAPGNQQQLLNEELRRLGLTNTDYAIHNLLQQRLLQEQQQKLGFAPFQTPNQFKPESISNLNSLDNLNFNYPNGFDRNRQLDPRSTSISNVNSVQQRNYENSREQERRIVQPNHMSAPPPGFSSNVRGGASRRDFDYNVDKDKVNNQEFNRRLLAEDANMHRGHRMSLTGQLDHPGPPSGSNLHSVSASDIEQSLLNLHREDGRLRWGQENMRREMAGNVEEQRDLSHLEDESDNKNHNGDANDKKQHRNGREKERSDNRGQRILSQRIRNIKWQMECRRDINHLSGPFVSIYESLIPAEEEKAKQKQLLSLLEKLVCKEWPTARLYLYGSCANSFGVSKSDIDVCLAIQEPDMNKSDILLKLADILQSDNLQNVQALTRARVPIVKLMDPVTGISCDICINNLLAVVNTKLLRDYAQIDVRLRQLAFIIKHWAKSRGVNETYQGTLSSYAYVLMCIHFLQQRRPPILPCLQGMGRTYSVTVDGIDCAYFDQVERLRDFGSSNKENIAQLVWAFFNYWAYGHDYASSVISVRTGSVISKMEKDWTRRIGNDRHLICIEDPFETSHDLGRVVDKYSIKVLREEFERAADIMQHDPNPCVTLFQPYVPS